MSGTTNLLIAAAFTPASGPTVHPVYSLDGLGVDDPPVIPISFGATDTFVDFTYALPDDGNAHKGLMVVAVFDPTQHKILELFLEGVSVGGLNAISTVLLQPTLYFRGTTIDSLTGSNWRLTRADASDGAINGWVRIYTFGDTTDSGTIFDGVNRVDLNTTPSPSVVDTGETVPQGACLFTLAVRDDWTSGRDFSVTDPLTYTYSPEGSAGVGLIDNEASTGGALEFQFISVDTPDPSVEWTFTDVQPGEHGGIHLESLNPATY